MGNKPNEIKWPILSFSQGIMQVYTDNSRLGTCSVTALSSGWFKNMRLIDSDGNVFSVKQVKTVPHVTLFNKLFLTVLDKKLDVELTDCKFTRKITIEEFQQKVCKQIDDREKEDNFWSASGDVMELKNNIKMCSSFENIMELLI